MKNRFLALALTSVFMALIFAAPQVFAKEKENTSSFAKKLPSFSLKDPAGKTFSDKEVSKNGLVLVVTAPILKNKDAQEGWEKFLNKDKGGSKAKLVFLEDMGPSAFKGKAKKEMKKEYKAGGEPILLIDNDSKTRKSLKVPEKKTVVLVYDGDGKLVHTEEGNPSAEAAKKIWDKAKG